MTYVLFKRDPREHVLVPKHTVCTSEEVEQLLKDEEIADLWYLRHIRMVDPQVMWAGGEVGDVIKTEEMTKVGKKIEWRLVVP